MSYILEALKRAEQDYKAQATSTAPAAAAESVVRSRPTRWAVGIAVGAVAGGIIVGFGLLLDRSVTRSVPGGGAETIVRIAREPGPDGAPRPVASSPTVAAAPTPATPRAPHVGASTPSSPSVGAAKPVESPAAVVGSSPSRSVARNRQDAAVRRTTPPRDSRAAVAPPPRAEPRAALPSASARATVPAPAPVPTESAPAAAVPAPAPPAPRPAAVAAAPVGRGVDLAALAATLKIQVVVWSANPKERMAFMNGTKYVEGQTVDGRVVVEQITEDGVVLAHQGDRVRISAATR